MSTTIVSAPGSTSYGVDIFGTVRYGYSQPKSLSIEPFYAVQSDYGRISLSWQSPNDSSWNRLKIVRNRDGYPSNPNDGDLLIEITTQSLRTSYEDTDLDQGRIYYYSAFMAQDASTWNSATTYNQSDVVSYNGHYWVSLQVNNTNHTPVAGSSYWNSTVYQPVWYPAGSVSALSVRDYGYSKYLYDRTPQPYKVVKSDIFSNTSIDNQPLYNFLSLFGYHLDMVRTDYTQLLSMNNTELVSAHKLDILGQQFGISTDYISSPRLRRERVKNVSVNYRLKGTAQGIHNAIAAVTGWDSDISIGSNMMLNSDQSAFIHPSYDLWRADVNYTAGQYVEYNGYNYVSRVAAYGSAQAPSGIGTTNTWWQYQVQNFDNTTLYNQSTTGISTWGRYNNAGISSSFGVMVGVPNPSNTTYNAWNAAAFKITSAVPLTGPTGIISIASLKISAWSNGTDFLTGSYVTHTDGNTYKAVKPSGPSYGGAVTPGSNNLVWDIQAPNIGVGKDQFVKDGIPIPSYPSYDSTFTYEPGDQIQYQGNLYLCVIRTFNNAPTGLYSSNVWWQYISSAENVYTASAYTTRFVSSADVVASELMTWYDAQGNLITTTTPPSNPTLFAKFDTDYSDLNGNTDNSLNKPWTVVPSGVAGMWQTSYGMASVNRAVFNLSSKPKYTYALIADGRANCTLGATFVNSYLDPAHYSSGIVFRYASSSTFWFATATQLVLVTGSSSESVQATWTKLSDGDRLLIILNGTNIQVKKYARDGIGTLTTLATITNSANSTATQHGLIQRYV